MVFDCIDSRSLPSSLLCGVSMHCALLGVSIDWVIRGISLLIGVCVFQSITCFLCLNGLGGLGVSVHYMGL